MRWIGEEKYLWHIEIAKFMPEIFGGIKAHNCHSKESNPFDTNVLSR
jgi:hypothetical protein